MTKESLHFTGERFLPEVGGNIALEHLHRYFQAREVAMGKTVLDIASGEGYGSAILADSARNVIGVDISIEAIDHARARYKKNNLQYLVGDCTNIPIDDASVDMVVSFETIEHHAHHEEMLLEIKRVLRKDGILLISSPDKKYYSDNINYKNPYHVKELYQYEFEQLISSHFKNAVYFGQRIVYGSAIFSKSTKTKLIDYLQNNENVEQTSGVLRPIYWVALASDSPLPEIASGILEQPIGDTEIVQYWNNAVSLRDNRIITLQDQLVNREAELAKRASQIATLSQELCEANQCRIAQHEQMTKFSQVVDEKNHVMDRLTVSLAQHKQEAAALTQTIDKIIASKSWRLTQSLRTASSAMYSLIEPLNQLLYRLQHIRDFIGLRDCPLFNAPWYLAQNPDVSQNGVNPLRHYLLWGWKESRDPGPEFDGEYYLNRYLDVAQTNEAPLLHYWRHGRREGRLINPALELEPIKKENQTNLSQEIESDNSSPNLTLPSAIIISVIIPTYNRFSLLPRIINAWRSVHIRTRFKYEIIFSDDGSTDGSLAYLQSIDDLPITVLRNSHGGASAARNAGINAACGERVLIMGDDIFPDPEIINAHVGLSRQLGSATAILGKVEWHPDLAVSYLMHHITSIGNEQFSYNRLEDNSFVDFRHFYTCNISLERLFLLEEKTLFDESFNEYGFEDIELGYRLARRGLKIFYSTLAKGDHYHPYTLESFCRRQVSTGKMAIVFATIHPGIEPMLGVSIIRKLSNKNSTKDADSIWRRRIDLLEQRCHFYEQIAAALPPGLSASVKVCLSSIYCRYFKAMFEYGVLQKIGCERNPLAKAMENNFEPSWATYWGALKNQESSINLSANSCLDFLRAVSENDPSLIPLESGFGALFNEFIFLTRHISSRLHDVTNQYRSLYIFRRLFYHLVNNPKYLLFTAKQVLTKGLISKLIRRQQAASLTGRTALPGLIVDSGDVENDQVIQLFHSTFGDFAPIYERSGDQLVARLGGLPEATESSQTKATIFFWPTPQHALPTADQLLNNYLAAVENGLDLSIISNTLSLGKLVSISTLRNHLFFSYDIVGAVFTNTLSNVAFRGKILRLLPAAHTQPNQALEELIDAEIHVDEYGFFFNRVKGPTNSANYESGYLPPQPKKKPVIFVFPIFLAVGGVERNTVEIMRQLCDRFDFVVITMERLRSEQGSLAAQAIEVAARVIEMSEVINHQGYLRLLSELKHSFQPDVVWVCNGSPWFCDNSMAIRLLFSDVPIVDQTAYDVKEGWINRYEDIGTKSFDRFIAINKKIEKRFIDDFRINPDHIDLIYSAVDIDRIKAFKNVQREPHILRKKFELPKSGEIFTFIGRLTSQKRPLEFLKLAERRLANPNELFVLVGDGELAPAVSAFIDQHKLTNVRRITYVENTLELHAISTGIIFTSAYEGLPIAMLEALAMGVPAFSTDVGDIADILEEFGGGAAYSTDLPTDEICKNFDSWLLMREIYLNNLKRRELNILNRFSSQVISEQYVQSWLVAAQKYGRKIP